MATFDEDYVRRLVAGDPAVEQHFITYFGELLHIKLRSRVRSPQLMEDVRQETFLRVFKTLRAHGMDHPERLGAYVNTVCNNVLFEGFRSESRFCDVGDDGATMIDPRACTDERFFTRERKEQVAAIMAELPDKDRELLQAIFLDEEDKDAVCRRYNVDRTYLRVLLHRARLRFRSAFEKAYIATP